uniref:UBR-type domain-containing protein n=1 Tax=Ditylenchus dipsaci TaxID=166011 RepID=A0A915E3N8_9BILA
MAKGEAQLGHSKIRLEHITLKFLPPNTTAASQPMQLTLEAQINEEVKNHGAGCEAMQPEEGNDELHQLWTELQQTNLVEELTMADNNTLNSSLKEDEAEKEEFLTWNEIVALNKEAEKNAEALLGGQDDMVCSYPEGYKYRQPLYSCRTCSAQTGQKAGVCYACSVNCHDGHDLIELYTKRKFCCDCGNSKFNEKCRLFEVWTLLSCCVHNGILFLEKDKVNSLNKYGHNFDQLYCVCNKKYPPPEDDEEILEEDMHQCCICEDWYHLPHIFDDDIEEKKLLENLLVSDMEDACDMICKGCATKIPLLMCYKSFAISMAVNNEGSAAPESSNIQISALPGVEGQFPKPHTIYFEGTSWREQLCKCSECLKLYDNLECDFLYYDEKRKENMALKGETSLKLEEDVNMASKVYDIVAKKTNNRDAALQAYMAVDEMTKYVSDFFQNADRTKVITKEDVQKCFEGLKAKRPRLDLDSSVDGAWTA